MLEVTFTIIRRNQFYKLVAATQQLNKNIESLGAPNFCLHNYIHRIVKKKNDFYTCKKSCKCIYFDSRWAEILSERASVVMAYLWGIQMRYVQEVCLMLVYFKLTESCQISRFINYLKNVCH